MKRIISILLMLCMFSSCLYTDCIKADEYEDFYRENYSRKASLIYVNESFIENINLSNELDESLLSIS